MGIASTAMGSASGSVQRGVIAPWMLKTLPNTQPKNAAERPPATKSFATGRRLRSHRPTAAMTSPWPTSPNM